MGWCTVKPIWRDRSGSMKKYEINISAEFLNIEFYETMTTLLHEMVHLYCTVNGIQDTSRGNTYHNKRFKEECLRRGFYYRDDKPDKRNGWYNAVLTDQAKITIDTYPINRDVFKIARDTYDMMPSDDEEEEEEKEKKDKEKRHNSIKWICPVCNMSVRSTKEVNIICGDCHEKMEAEIE